jgi:hypothetical protein
MIDTAKLEEAIDTAGAQFDSHEIIRKVTQKYQREYILQLYDQRDRVAPFQYVHSKLGRDITAICTGRGYARADERNADIFGQSSKCIWWTKQI